MSSEVELNITITIGDVFFLRCKNCDPPKDKFFVIAQVDPLITFLINSNRTSFAETREPYRKATPVIYAAQHVEFLQHDSVVGCDQLWFEYSHEELLRRIRNEPGVRVGRLHVGAVRAVCHALEGNLLLKKKHLNQLVPSWRDHLAALEQRENP